MKKKYFYENITFYKYCQANELPYSYVICFFRYHLKKETDSASSIESLITSANSAFTSSIS